MFVTKLKYMFQSNKVDLFPDENCWLLTDVQTRPEAFRGCFSKTGGQEKAWFSFKALMSFFNMLYLKTVPKKNIYLCFKSTGS